MILQYFGEICPLNDKRSKTHHANSERYKTSFLDLKYEFMNQKQRHPNHLQFPFLSKVFVKIVFSRVYTVDSDALLKIIFDTLQAAGIIKNDRQIKGHLVLCDESIKENKLTLEITPLIVSGSLHEALLQNKISQEVLRLW